MAFKFLENKTTRGLFVLGVVLVLCYYLKRSTENYENVEDYENSDVNTSLNMKPCYCQGPCNCNPPLGPQCGPNPQLPPAPTCPSEVKGQCNSSPALQELEQASCFPQSQLSPEELLPSSSCNVWSDSSGQLADRNFLQAGWATGISSVGQTKRNANLQLRSEVPNPQVSVSPWLQTTIAPDLLRKPLEMGGCSG